MLISQNKKQLVLNSLLELDDDLTVEKKGKGRKFVSKFIEPGIAHYQEFGDVLITKETLDKFVLSMVGCPLIINHKEITDKNADKERIGVISNVWYNESDGWYYCDGIIWNKQAIDLVKNQGWSVSCTYDFVSDNQEKTHNGKKIDLEFIDGNFLHLALVPNPRYERANIVINSKDKAVNEQGSTTKNEKWITIKPHGKDADDYKRLKLEDGENPKEAIERVYKKGDKDTKIKELEEKAYKEFKGLYENYIKGDVKISDFSKAKENFNKKYKKEFKELQSEKFTSFEDLAKKENNKKDDKKFIDKKGNRHSLEDLINQGFYPNRYGSSLWNKNPSYSVSKDNIEFPISETEYKNAKEYHKAKQEKDLQKAKADSKKLTEYVEYQTNADIKPLKTELNPNNRQDNQKDKVIKVQNRKDTNIMAGLEALEIIKDYVLGVIKNESDKTKKVENVDKRKIIDEIGGILKGKVSEEIWRTVIGKIELLANNPSETDKADNKCKNGDEEEIKKEKFEEEKEIADNKKAKNEDKEENKKVENSMEDIRSKIMGGSVQLPSKVSYISQADRLKAGEQY